LRLRASGSLVQGFSRRASKPRQLPLPSPGQPAVPAPARAAGLPARQTLRRD